MTVLVVATLMDQDGDDLCRVLLMHLEKRETERNLAETGRRIGMDIVLEALFKFDLLTCVETCSFCLFCDCISEDVPCPVAKLLKLTEKRLYQEWIDVHNDDLDESC